MGLLSRLTSFAGRGPSHAPDAFAALVHSRLVAAGVVDAADYDPDTFSLLVHKPGRTIDEARINLHNFFAEYRREPACRRDAVVNRIVQALRDQDTTLNPDQALASLMLRLQPRSWPTIAQLDVAHQVIADRLAVCLCIDLPRSMQLATRQHLTDWNVSEEEAFAIASANLGRASDLPFEQIAPGLYRSPWQDNYDAARLALPWIIERIPVRGDPASRVAAAPNRDCLLVAGLDDHDALRRLIAQTEDEAQSERDVTRQLHLVRDGHVSRLLPSLPEGHPLYSYVKRLDAAELVRQYAESHDAAIEALDDESEDVFVASVTTMQASDGRLHTYAVWSAGVDTLLPETDLIALLGYATPDDPTGPILGLFPFHHVRTLAGPLWDPVPGYPPRYRARTFLDASQLAHLGPPVVKPTPDGR